MFNFLKKISSFLSCVQLLVGLIKPIKEAIKAVEQPGYGEEKKETVLNLLREVILTAEDMVPGLDISEDTILNYADGIIDIIVAFYNLTGKFKKSEGAPSGK